VTPNTYSLDCVNIIQICKLEFKDTNNSFLALTESFQILPLTNRLKILMEFQSQLDATQCKGYLNSIDLSTFPIFSELLPYFITESDQSKSCLNINGDKSMETYK
jgi:hypothetical protein